MSSIIDLQVSVNKDEEKKLLAQGFHSVPGPLIKRAPGTVTCLWYKRGNPPGINRIQVSFTKEMADGLASGGYKKIDKNLNAGAGGDEIYLWYYKPTKPSLTLYDDRIMVLYVASQADDEPDMFRLGWERLSYDLNLKAGGKLANLWFRRKSPRYICDISVCLNFEGDAQRFQNGWIRVDVPTNSSSGEKVFIWYRVTGDPKEAITDLKVSSDDVKSYEKVKQELCLGPSGKKIFLWYTKSNSFTPIQDVTVLTNSSSTTAYQQAGNHIFPINPISDAPKFLCYYSRESSG